MKMFTNKHVIVAMLVAPVLAILAWFAVDSLVAPTPIVATPGEAFPLLARSNCRYDSGQCDLVNGDFELTLRPTAIQGREIDLELVSKYKLQQATIGIAVGSDDDRPREMAAADRAGRLWVASLVTPGDTAATIRLAVVAEGTMYYAEVPVVFLDLQS